MCSNYYVVEYKILKSTKPHLMCILSYSPYAGSLGDLQFTKLSYHIVLFDIYISMSTVPIIQATKPTMRFFGRFRSDPDHSKSSEIHCKWCSVSAIVLESENLDQTLSRGLN